MRKKFLPVAIFVLLSALGASGQSTRPSPNPDPKPGPKIPDVTTDDQKEVNLPEDMRIKMAIARAESEHKKILEDVEKLGDLSN